MSVGPITRRIGGIARSCARRGELRASRVQLIAEQRSGKRSIDEAGGHQIDSDRSDLKRERPGERWHSGRERIDECARGRPATALVSS
jgi:hypothetical protein